MGTGTADKGENIQEKRYIESKCQRCGRKTVRDDGEVIGELVTLVKEMEGYAFNLYLGEWCSEDCFLEDMKDYWRSNERENSRD